MSGKMKRKGKAGEKYAMIERMVRNTPAFQALSTNSRCLYLEFLFKFNGRNNGFIGFGCREAGTLVGCSKDSAATSFLQLEEHGFIVNTKASNYDVKKIAREWRLTTRKCDLSNKPATHDYRHWMPKKQNTVASQGQGVAFQGQNSNERPEKCG